MREMQNFPLYEQVWIQESNRCYNIKERVAKGIVPGGGGGGSYEIGKVMLGEGACQERVSEWHMAQGMEKECVGR